jgi:hypothetical protein
MSRAWRDTIATLVEGWMNLIHRIWSAHPNLASWALLAIGMVVIVIVAARNVGFLPGQWAAVIVATILLAGLCVWIISWEDDGK